MKTIKSCEFNMDTGCVELRFQDGSMISIDCTAVENEVADNPYERSELDYLIYNDPLAYADLMLCCKIERGALFYGMPRRRMEITFTDELRKEVLEAIAEMHDMYSRGYTPKVKPTKSCAACSLNELCLPSLMKKRSVGAYIRAAMEEIT